MASSRNYLPPASVYSPAPKAWGGGYTFTGWWGGGCSNILVEARHWICLLQFNPSAHRINLRNISPHTLQMISVLFGVSFTLKPNKELTTRINCLHLYCIIFNFPNWKFVCWVSSSAGAKRRTGNSRQPLLGSSSLPFSPLLQMSSKFSHEI